MSKINILLISLLLLICFCGCGMDIGLHKERDDVALNIDIDTPIIDLNISTSADDELTTIISFFEDDKENEDMDENEESASKYIFV